MTQVYFHCSNTRGVLMDRRGASVEIDRFAATPSPPSPKPLIVPASNQPVLTR